MLLADTPASAPMMAPMSAPMAAAAPVAAEAAAAPDAVATPMAVPQATPAPQGCALSFVQGNSSYSKFKQILDAAPSTSNFSSALLAVFLCVYHFLSSCLPQYMHQ